MPQTLVLAPDPDQAIGQLTSIFNSANGVTQWASTLVNAFLPAMSPTPDWYTDISAAIAAAQADANSWLNDTGPGVISGMCNAFLDYSGTFSQIVTNQLAPVLAQIRTQNNIPTPAQKQQLVSIFTALQGITNRHGTTTQTLLGAMSGYKKDLDASLTTLDAAITQALPAETKASQTVAKIQAQIQDIEITLAADNSSATADSFNIESGMQSLAVGLTFGLTFDPVGFGIALLGLGVNIIISAEAEAQVQADLKEIAALSATLAADETQLALLQGIVSNLKSLQTNVIAAVSVYSEFDSSWQDAATEIANLLEILAQPEINISTISYFEVANVNQALVDWSTIAAFASKVLLARVVPQPGLTISGNAVTPTIPAAQTNLVANLNLSARLTAWCSAIVNTTVVQSSGAWYPVFMGNLAVAQTHAVEYLDIVGPNALSAVPNSIVTYAAERQQVMNFVESILSEAGANDLTATQLNTIKTVFAQRLQPTLESLLGTPLSTNIGLPQGTPPTLYGSKNDLISFRTKVTADRVALVEGQQGAAQEVGLLDIDEQTMSTNLANLHTKISVWNQDILESEIGIGASLFAAVVGIALAVATGGGALVITGVGVAGLGGSIAATAVYTKKVNNALAQVQSDQTELTDDQKQVSSLLAVIQAFQNLEQLNAAAQTAAEQIVTMFAGLAGQTKATIRRLESADSATAKGILESIRIEQALSNWDALATLASGVLNSIITKQILTQPQ